MTPRTPEEIINQTNDLAAAFYLLHGKKRPNGFRFWEATHPEERLMWELAVSAQEMLTDTNVDDCLAEMDGAR
jgi:hypothetical protein